MPIYRLNRTPIFPDPRLAEENGLLAVGGDLSVPRLVNAYATGIFPWFGEADPILWWSPPQRALILPGEERFSRRTQRALRHAGFEIRVDTAFAEVVTACRHVSRKGQEDTWITPEMCDAYGALHQAGFAHSFEAYLADELVGGLYGVSLGAAFFGESMFSKVDYASRAAFQRLCTMAWNWGFHFIDGQVPNDNLRHLGSRTIPRDDFLTKLRSALEHETRQGSWTGAALHTFPNIR
jgi:leucyl/phenylalanyl-tRNA---protein transferase